MIWEVLSNDVSVRQQDIADSLEENETIIVWERNCIEKHITLMWES